MVDPPIARFYDGAARQSDDASAWSRPIHLDQLIATRRSVAISLPVNILLSLICATVAWHTGERQAAALWLSASLLVSALRSALHFAARARAREIHAPMTLGEIKRALGVLWLVTLLSGCVWALLPALCAFYTSPQSLIFLALGCGITAGAVSHGGACARVPIAFITPPILSAAAAMVYVGGFDRYALAVTMLLYLAALVATARQAERVFRRTSLLTQRVTGMNHLLERAHDRAVVVAAEMRHRADHDPLTGLLNRAGFLREASTQGRNQEHPSVLMLLDLDGFKAINDAFGHQTGDDILVEVAERLCRTLPGEVLVGRWGGDEFAILYATDAALAPPGALADHLIDVIAAPYRAFGTLARVGLSVGIHVSRQVDMPEMLSCADLALYAAKSAGRNRHNVFDDALRAQLDIRRDIARDLPAALGDGSIQIWFQPIFGDGGTKVCGLEALIRWSHPVHGAIPPAELMATAARAGFARPLMERILDRVCVMIAALRDRGLVHVSVAMNVSPREMAQLPVDSLILDALATRHLDPGALEIEITEETALDAAHCAQKLASLSGAGIRVAIDDFGIGHSSLALLRTLHVDRIKIDRCFVTGLANSPDDQVLVKAMLNLGQSLQIDVIAEGVESIDDLRTLRAFGCRTMQGYHLGRPMPGESCLALIANTAGCDTLPLAVAPNILPSAAQA